MECWQINADENNISIRKVLCSQLIAFTSHQKELNNTSGTVQFRARQWLVTYDSFFDFLPSLPEITGVICCWLRRSGGLGEVGGKEADVCLSYLDPASHESCGFNI